MNIQMLKKAGPVLGLIVSLSTTSFAGYKIFAAPLQHKADVPALPDPTPTAESAPDEIVETVYVDEPNAAATPTPTPKLVSVSAAANVSSRAVLTLPTAPTGVGSRDHDSDDDDKFEDESDDRLSIKREDDHNEYEAPEPTEKPEH